ncbi:MAG TPA: aminotransferase class IV [Chryseosolibacter sp.]
MCRLIESIRLHDGKFYNLFYHEQRMIRTLQTLFGQHPPIDLAAYLADTAYPPEGLFKCRIVYDRKTMHTTFTSYEPRKIQSLRVVHADYLNYEFKFEDRQALDRLFELRNGCDDILITRRGVVTDCSFANIIFRKGNSWVTPDRPLLRGTMRQNLMDRNAVQVQEITIPDLRSFQSFKIINAMVGFDSPEIEVSNIVF